MDYRFRTFFNKYFQPTPAQINAILAEIKTGGAIATNLNTLQARMDLMLAFFMNHANSAAGLTIGSVDAKKLKIANTVGYLAAGVFYSKTTAETVFGADAASVVAASKFVKYLVTLPASGTPHVIEGNIAASAGAALLPAVPANEAPIGYCQVATGAGGGFTPDTTALSDANVTDTYVDLTWPDSGVSTIAAALGTQVHSVIAALSEPNRFGP